MKWTPWWKNFFDWWSVASCILRRQALCGEINRRFCELPACFRRADNFLLPLYESNLSGRDIEYLFDKQDSYTISKYFFNCEKCIVLDKSRYRCWFISRVKLKSWREKRWIWLKYYLLGQRSLSKKTGTYTLKLSFWLFYRWTKIWKDFPCDILRIYKYRETLLNNFEQKLK